MISTLSAAGPKTYKFPCRIVLPQLFQGRRKRTRPPLKENRLDNFSGLKESLSRPVADTKPRKSYLPPQSFLCCPPSLFWQRKWSRVVYGFFFPMFALSARNNSLRNMGGHILYAPPPPLKIPFRSSRGGGLEAQQ